MIRSSSFVAFFAIAFALINGPASGMSIRDDKTESPYQDQLSTAPFDATGMISNQSGTLIRPTWVLASAHAGGSMGDTFETVNGSANVLNRFDFPGDPNTNDAFDGADFSLFELDAPMTGSTAELFQGSAGTLVGETAVYAGGGKTGDGDTGATGSPELLAGTNVIDVAGVDFGSGVVANIVESDFDDPDPPNIGSAVQELEMGLAGGDSGGGIWVDLDDGFVLAGVHSGVSDDGDEVLGEYGQSNFSTILTDDARTWIFETIPEPATGGLLVIGGLALGGRRRRA